MSIAIDEETLIVGLSRVLPYVLLATAATLVAPAPLSAQQYPTKPVKIIVPFAPGGGFDLTARLVAQRLSTTLGQQFIVENKPGAGGSIGFRSGVKSTRSTPVSTGSTTTRLQTSRQ